jgi:hypothetical protein
MQLALGAGPEAQTCRLADDILLQAEFTRLGEGYALARRDLYLCPRNGPSSRRQRIVSETYDVGPAEKQAVDASSEMGADEVEKGSSHQPGDLWFGIPWEGGGEGVRAEPPQRSGFLGRRAADLQDPYQRWVSRTLVLEKSFVRLGTRLLNAARRSSDKEPVDLSEEKVEFRVEQKERVRSEEGVPQMQFLQPDVAVREHLGTPRWVTPGQEAVWKTVRRDVLAPLLKEMNRSLSLDPSHVPSFRARPERYYRPEDPITPLLRDYREAHPSVRAEVEEWTEKFEIGLDLRVEQIAGDLYAPSVERDGRRRHLADLGSGTAQLLPLILRLTAQQASEPLIIEEPESHLHPKLQAHLGDLLTTMIGKGHQMLVETHSEHLTRRIQYLVSEGELKSDHVSLLYVDARRQSGEDGPPVRSISIDEDGQLSAPFGRGFFDETGRIGHLFKYGSEN